MAKHVLNKMKLVRPVALAILGWLAFGLGTTIYDCAEIVGPTTPPA